MKPGVGVGGEKKPTIVKVKKSRMRVYRKHNVKERNNKANKQIPDPDAINQFGTTNLAIQRNAEG